MARNDEDEVLGEAISRNLSSEELGHFIQREKQSLRFPDPRDQSRIVLGDEEEAWVLLSEEEVDSEKKGQEERMEVSHRVIWWRRWESNPRPEKLHKEPSTCFASFFHVSPLYGKRANRKGS